jgi:hypothetical protein
MTNAQTSLVVPPAKRGSVIRHSSFTIRGLAAAALFSLSTSAHACAVCFGNSDSKLTQGMLAGVLVLLFVVLAVLGGLVAMFIFLARKSAEAAATEKQSESKV